MSDKKIPSVCLVVDASIARASGPPESTHPLGARVRDFLMRLRGVGHRMAWNKAIKAEWHKHQSSFARQWFVSMFKVNKIRTVPDDEVKALREAITNHSEDAGVIAAMVKDVHLIEAALASDSRISSLDDTVRQHFCRLASTCELVRMVTWVNPATDAADAVEWLDDGAPDEPARHLKA